MAQCSRPRTPVRPRARRNVRSCNYGSPAPATGRLTGPGTEPAGQGRQSCHQSFHPAAHCLARPGDCTAGQGVPGPIAAQCFPPPTSHAVPQRTGGGLPDYGHTGGLSTRIGLTGSQGLDFAGGTRAMVAGQWPQTRPAVDLGRSGCRASRAVYGGAVRDSAGMHPPTLRYSTPTPLSLRP